MKLHFSSLFSFVSRGNFKDTESVSEAHAAPWSRYTSWSVLSDAAAAGPLPSRLQGL